MALSPLVVNRLQNWKFNQGLTGAENDPDVTQKERDLLHVLSRLFGNSGWFDGDMGALVDAALDSIIVSEPDEEI